MTRDSDDISTDRNDISTEQSAGPEENDNLGSEGNKGEPTTSVPSGPASDDDGDVLADDPEQD
ncbi:hypothetical protein [Microbacterium sp. APC 3901]|uniref:hypothetical protein n=1 Tax=Microbacterium sp. APC 3901 TaxID=3035192 RepID=UPI0025B45DD0|nr:hypothetical protein [Microbacterium sp. APC 3901]MDN3444374.1 hypothetical protein [Microbacterium sp. APC 3901]